MKKMITVFGVLALAISPTTVLRNIVSNKKQNFVNVIKKTNNGVDNAISVNEVSRYQFKFSVTLSSSDYNGFTGFLDQIVFNLSDYNFHAWPIYLFQWLDDDDFHTGPFPELKQHTAHGFFNDPITWANRLENHMGHFGSWWKDKSDTAFDMASSWGQWGTFGQNIDNTYNNAVATHKALGIIFNFGFKWSQNLFHTYQPSFSIITN